MELSAPEFDALERGESVTVERDRLAVSWGGRVIAWKKGWNDNPTLLCYVAHVPYGNEQRAVTLRRCAPKK